MKLNMIKIILLIQNDLWLDNTNILSEIIKESILFINNVEFHFYNY